MRSRTAILACIAVGAAINIGVAWSIALWAPGPTATRGRRVQLQPPANWPRAVPEHWAPPDAAWVRTVYGLTRESMFTGYRAGDYLTTAGREIHWAGWPLRTLRWESWYDRRSFLVRPRETLAAYWLRDGIEPPVWVPGLDGAEWRRIPVRPVWPGLAVNTAVYATISWAVVFSPGVLRRRRRRRRGWCIACAYDLAGLGQCPECGRMAEPAP